MATHEHGCGYCCQQFELQRRACLQQRALDEAYVPFFGAFGAAWDDGMVARWSTSPLAMLWPEMDAAFVTSGRNGGGPPAARRPIVIVANG